MERLLVLGSDYYTKDIVIEAKRRGCYVIVADYNEITPTKLLADESWLISTADVDILEAKCRNTKVSAIITGASDFNTEISRILCKRLDLPLYCDNDVAWEASRNKSRFKEACKLMGAPVSPDYNITDDLSDKELIEVQYPVVVKPVDKSANRGMSYCYNREELLAGYKKARNISDNEKIIVEKMLAGTEYNVCYCVANGNIRLVSFAELCHGGDQLGNIYSYEGNTSKHLKQYLEEVNEKLISVFKYLGCTEGVVWVDTMRNSLDGKFYILEMGYRVPAAVVSSPLYEKVNGFNLIKWMVDCALGIRHTIDVMPDPLESAYTAILGEAHMFVNKNSVISKVVGLEEIGKLDNVLVDMPKMRGQSINAYMCGALISMFGKDADDICSTLKIINETFAIYDEQGNDVTIRYTDYEGIKQRYEQGNLQFHN